MWSSLKRSSESGPFKAGKALGRGKEESNKEDGGEGIERRVKKEPRSPKR